MSSSANRSQQQAAYQLKTTRYNDTPAKILLQNENGPCPLLAAANALLLRGVVSLDPACVRNGVASTDDVVNMLANRALMTTAGSGSGSGSGKNDGSGGEEATHHLNEVLGILPKLQHGMDVNPKFTSGPTGVEYTTNLAAFDLLGVELVHGWLLDPQDTETAAVVGNKTYNELIETVIHGSEAKEAARELESRLLEKQRLLDENVRVPGESEGGKTGDDNAVEGSQNVNPGDLDATAGEGNAQSITAGDDSHVSKESKDGNQPECGAVTGTGEEEGAQTCQVGDENVVSEENKDGNGSDYEDVAGAENGERGDSQNESSQNTPVNENSPAIPAQTGESDATNSAKPIESLTEDEEIALRREIIDMRSKLSDLSLQITRSAVANAFLTSSGHQLTHHGLERLHDHVPDGALCVFFRNNHFATLTKRRGVLYLLVTDLGYANVPEIVWEKLDNIDGDTEYANEFFRRPKPRTELGPASGPTIAPELMLAQRNQAESDYQLALAMSKGTVDANGATRHRMDNADEDEGRLMEAARELSLKTYHGDNGAEVSVGFPDGRVGGGGGGDTSQMDSDREIAMAYERAQRQSEHESEQLARQLQELEYARQRPAANTRTTPARPPTANAAPAASGCIVS